MTASILAFDCSSKAIGWVVYNGAVQARGVIRLDPKADISERCLTAKSEVGVLLMRYPPDAVALESPVMRYGSSIPQIRVGAMVLLACAEHSLAWCEVTPAAGKKALCQNGAATKREMLEAAAPHFGCDVKDLEFFCYREEWGAWAAALQFSEHEADALGVAMATVGKVEVEEAV